MGGNGKQVPRERGLLDDVGPLHHDGAVDVRTRQLAREDLADLEHLGERQVRGGHQPPVDRLDIRQLGQPGTVASSSSPRSVGTFPAPDVRIEIVPPVKTTAIEDVP